MTERKHRNRSGHGHSVAFSISYQRDDLLARGLGIEHLRELLVRLARPVVRAGAGIAYDGAWRDEPGNFTFVLLQLINAEREDNVTGGPDTGLQIGGLVNHLAWPNYLEVTPAIEARWIHCCRIVRVTQEDAGLTDLVADDQAKSGSDPALWNAAVTLSAMRRLSPHSRSISIPDAASERIVGPRARIVLGGKLAGYRGFLPGVLEEVLVALEAQIPLYVLGGFGGVAEAVAQAFRDRTVTPPLTMAWNDQQAPELKRLRESGFNLPPSGLVRAADTMLAELRRRATEDRPLAEKFATGLDEHDTAELMSTSDPDRAVQLVRRGLERTLGIRAG